tara:strand:+ start:1378 stop:1998 length:621 start_codon:yes stop_codon:yes gene_type:complete
MSKFWRRKQAKFSVFVTISKESVNLLKIKLEKMKLCDTVGINGINKININLFENNKMANPKLDIKNQMVSFLPTNYEKIFRQRAIAIKEKLEKQQGKKITWNELAEKANLDPETTSRILNGTQKNIRLHEAIGIADALKTTVSYLVNFHDTKFMLDQTRSTYQYFVTDLENNLQAQAYLKEREEQIKKQLEYFQKILYRVDALDEH